LGIYYDEDLLLPTDYVSGTALLSSATWYNETFGSLGLAPGSYVYSWGLGIEADSLTLNIVDPNAVPEPDTLALVCGGVFSFLAFATMRRRTAIARHR
jgi:hypothetical protein